MANRTGKSSSTGGNFLYRLGKPLTQATLLGLTSLHHLTKTSKKRSKPQKKPALPLPNQFALNLILITARLTAQLKASEAARLAKKITKKRTLQKKLAGLNRRFKTPKKLSLFKSGPKAHLGQRRHQLSGSKPLADTLNLKPLILIGLILALLSTYYFYTSVLKDLPHPSRLATDKPSVTTKIYDRHGNLLFKIFRNENRSIVSLNDIPLELQQATIAIEDQNFYHHSGFDFRGIIRALKSNLDGDSLQGGSTITQQLIKNTLLTPEKTITRKIKEVILSITAEFYFTKDEILTMYFNQAPYGGASYGVEEASQMFFGKSAKHLDLAESAFLAGLPAAPTRNSPYGTQPEFAIARQHQVLRRMVEDGYISLTEAETAKAKRLTILPQKNSIKAPHFVMYVKSLLVEKYGLQAVEQGGLEVITSLDLNVQELTQNLLTSEVNSLKNLNVQNGAALVTNPKTGEILAMVGSTDYFAAENDGQVNVTLRLRQPGSSIKPINYAAALENGFTPATIIPDTPICYRLPAQKPYCPKNYDGKHHGFVTLRQALASSYNIPAVKTLSQIGVAKMIEKGREMGITTWEDSTRFGLSLTLGGGEIKAIDMAVAYSSFANNGLRVDLNPILEVKNFEGKTLEKLDCQVLTNARISPITPVNASTTTCSGTRALDPAVAFQITDILSDNQARSRAFGLNSVLNIPGHQVAVKTGTTNSLRDNWTIGYTTDRLVVTWVGNNDNSPMSYIASGITGASPIWHNIMAALLSDNEPHTFQPPANLTKVSICTLTGTLSCSGCPSKEEYFLPGTQPKNHCSSQQIKAIKTKREEQNSNPSEASGEGGRDRILEGASTEGF